MGVRLVKDASVADHQRASAATQNHATKLVRFEVGAGVK